MRSQAKFFCATIIICSAWSSTFASSIELDDGCQKFLVALRTEDLHPSSQYWEINGEQSENKSKALSHVASPADRLRFLRHRVRPLGPRLAETLERERKEARVFDHGRYIERHFSKRTFAYLAEHRRDRIVIAPGDIDEVASFARGGGARRIEILPKNSLTDFTVMIAFHANGHRQIYIQVLPGRSAVIEAVANLLHYESGTSPVITSTRVDVLDSLHSGPGKIAELLLANKAADVDGVFFGYSSNLMRVAMSAGGRVLREINEIDLFARVIEVRGKKILSVPVTPYAFGDRAADILRGVHQALAKPRLVVTVGIAGTLDPVVDVDSYVVPTTFKQNENVRSFENLALGINLPAHRARASESVDSILQETRTWLERARAAQISIVEQEGFDLSVASKQLGYPLAAVYRVSDRVGFGFDDFNSIEFSYQPDEKLSAWQMAMIELLTGPDGPSNPWHSN